MRTLLALAVALGTALVPGPLSAQPPAVVTLDKLTEYLSLGVPEAKLLTLVADSPAVFVLGQAEEAALRKAGASDALIDAIKAKAKATPQAGDIRAFVVILDVSGSMADKDTAGVAKWGPAQKAAIDLVAAVPDGRQLAFVVYGHDAKKECESVEVVLALSEATAEAKGRLKEYIQKLKPAGHTPIAASLKLAGGELKKAEGLSKVILITDGMETCHGDPNKEAAELAKIDTFRGVDVVALGLTAAESKAVGGIAQAGKGKYYDAKTTADLTRSVATIAAAIKKPQPEPVKVDRPKLSPLEQALVEKLTDKNWKVRKEACDGLAGLKSKAAAAWVADFVGGESFDLQPGTRRESSRDAALGYLKEFGPEHLNGALIRGLSAKNLSVREWCGLAAGTIAPPVDADPAKLTPLDQALVACVTDPAWEIRRAGCEGLRGRKCKAAATAVADFLAGDLFNKRPGTPREESRDAAVQFLKEIAPDQVEATLVRALKSSKPEVKAWAGAAVANLKK